MGTCIRLDRFLARSGAGSRADVKKQIRAGRILINGEAVKSSDVKVDPDNDIILMDGKRMQLASTPTVMMNKPAGVVSATQDNYDRTVIDLIREPWADELFPMGRLDKDTEGLMILTANGKMSHELLSPKKHVEKTYFAVINGGPDEAMAERFREGVDIGEKRSTLPAKLSFLEKDQSPDHFWASGISGQDLERCREDECCVVITITEGKFHQIKRMFASQDREVHYLKRIAMGRLVLDPALESGQYRILTEEELSLLKAR